MGESVYNLSRPVRGFFGTFRLWGTRLDRNPNKPALMLQEFVQLVFVLTLAQYFFTKIIFLYFGMVLYILVHYLFSVCDLLFWLCFIGDYS